MRYQVTKDLQESLESFRYLRELNERCTKLEELMGADMARLDERIANLEENRARKGEDIAKRIEDLAKYQENGTTKVENATLQVKYAKSKPEQERKCIMGLAAYDCMKLKQLMIKSAYPTLDDNDRATIRFSEIFKKVDNDNVDSNAAAQLYDTLVLSRRYRTVNAFKTILNDKKDYCNNDFIIMPMKELIYCTMNFI